MNDQGKIWSAIRSQLALLRLDIRHAADEESTEMELILLDGISRKLADAVMKELEKRLPCGMKNHHETCDCGGVAGDR